jgi:hypothetical protein
MYHMSTPVAIRFDEELLAEVRRVARRRATSVSAVVQTFATEALRMDRVPGIVFRDGPGGRRATVAGGPDVWEVIETLRAVEGDRGLPALAEASGLPVRTVAVALDYYGYYPDEIDAWIEENDRAAEEARAAWQRRQTFA